MCKAAAAVTRSIIVNDASIGKNSACIEYTRMKKKKGGEHCPATMEIYTNIDV